MRSAIISLFLFLNALPVIAENISQGNEETFREALSEVNDGIDFSVYRGSIEALLMELDRFGKYAALVSDGLSSNDEEIRNLAKQLETVVINMQTNEFPKLRKEYVKVMEKTLQVQGFDVRLDVVNANRRIEIACGLCGVDVEGVNRAIHMRNIRNLKLFRFSTSRYKSRMSDGMFVYFDISSPKDSELVIF